MPPSEADTAADAALPGAMQPTFRDPAGSLTVLDGVAVRSIHPSARTEVLAFLGSPLCNRLVARGDLVASIVDDGPDASLRLFHPLVPVPTYPWEWTASQWLAAAELSLSLCDEGLAEGWILKDATPLNILFLGPRPVLVDVLSFERWSPVADASHPAPQLWLAYGQYMRTFLLPLLMNRLLSWPLALALFRRDGYEPGGLFHALSWTQRLSRAAFWPVTVPTLLEKRETPGAPAPPAPRGTRDPGLATHILRRTLAGLRRMTRRAMPKLSSSSWSEYKGTLTHYTSAESAQKLAWVRQVLTDLQAEPAKSFRVLDIGANTGEFSALAAGSGASVVALERDPAAADRLFRMARDRSLDILTIHADLSRPTPAAGWDNRETLSLLQRLQVREPGGLPAVASRAAAAGFPAPVPGFDLVLMLAVIHHLLLMEQIPLPAILALCHRLTRRHLVLEWVPPTDPMYISLMRGRDNLYGALSETDLLAACEGRFHILSRHPLDNGRVLFLLEKQPPCPL